MLFSIMAAPVCISTNSAQGFTSLPTFVTCKLSDDSHSDTYKVTVYCGSDLH